MNDEYNIIRFVKISEVINDEQLLDFALSHIIERDENEVHYIAEEILLIYIINLLYKDGKDKFNEQDLIDKRSELISSYLLTSLTKKGLTEAFFDEHGEIYYGLTNKGKEKIKNVY
jgi:hypothetical protein